MSSDLTIPDTHDIAAWVEAIKLIDTDEPVIGGIDGVSNAQAIQLAQRAQWLKTVLDKVVDAAGGIDATTDNLDQLRQAIDALIAGAAPGSASTTAAGLVELATATEARTGTDTTRAVTPAGLAAALSTLQDVSAAIAAHAASRDHPAATTSAQGLVELATTTETQAGTDTARAVTPAGVTAALSRHTDATDPHPQYLGKEPDTNTYNVDGWLSLHGQYGLQADANSGYLYPNGRSQHTPWQVEGTRGGWGGLYFYPANIDFMIGPEQQGIYSESANAWQWRFQNGALIDGSVPWGRVTGVPAASTTTAGLVELATSAETQNGTDATRAVTPAGLLSMFGRQLGSNGYQRLPGGLILQWGHLSPVSGGQMTVTFPIAFPTACYSVVSTPDSSGGGVEIINLTSLTNTNFLIMRIVGNGVVEGPAWWMAIGS